MRRWGYLLGQGLLLLAGFVAIHWWQTRPLAEGQAPELRGPTVNGHGLDLASLRGRPALVHFWATWCHICRLEENGIDAIARDWAVVTVAMESGDAAKIRAYLADDGLSFPTIADPQGLIAGTWGVSAVPASFVIGPEGRIRFTEVGLTSEMGLRARLWAVSR